MLLQDYLDYDQLDADLCDGYVVRRRHSDLSLDLYTYSRSAQYDSHWTESTIKCRGLIVDSQTDEIVAFCMPKFFNKSEHDNGKSYADSLPEEGCSIFEKIDGSMGTIFFYNDEWHVATKGSFISDQAIEALKMLRAADTRYLVPGITYVAEIVYPENRIVVDYKNRHDLVLLTSYLPDGREVLRPESWAGTGFSYVPEIDIMHLTYTLNIDDLTFEHIIDSGTEAEGYVVRFDSGVRVKMKFPEYLALHKILTNCTERTIWEALYNEIDMSTFRENVPDEFDDWVTDTVDKINDSVDSFQTNCNIKFERITRKTGYADRKAFALEASKLDPVYKSAMFLMYDGKSTRDLAFKSCYPDAVKPFRQDDE